MRPTRAPRRAIIAGVIMSIVVAGCGSDESASDDGTATSAATPPPTTEARPATTATPATDAPTTDPPPTTGAGTTVAATGGADGLGIPGGAASVEFCQAFVTLDRSVGELPEDPVEAEAFVAERITPNLSIARSEAPVAIGAEIEVMVSTVETVLATGDFSATGSPEFTAAASVVYPSLDEQCGFAEIAVDAVDFAFEGVPAEVPAGIVTIVMTNSSASGEAHELELIKVKDGVDTPVEELVTMPEEQVNELLDTFGGTTFAEAGTTSGTTVSLTPGRWIYACLIPQGSVNGAFGTGAPHTTSGMLGDLIVT